MIRKLNTPTAILLVTCLTLAPTALAADGASGSWFTDLIDIVKEWVVGGDDLASDTDTEAEAPAKNGSMLECEPGGEAGPFVDPNGPGC